MLRMRFASIIISDDERTIDFYVNKLGFELVHDNPAPGGLRFMMFKPTGGGAHLVASRPIPGRPNQVAGGPSNISWETEDVEALYEELRAKGVEFVQPPTKRFWGGVEAIFADPDGNQFLLQQGGM